jgi:hypothetical protein
MAEMKKKPENDKKCQKFPKMLKMTKNSRIPENDKKCYKCIKC